MGFIEKITNFIGGGDKEKKDNQDFIELVKLLKLDKKWKNEILEYNIKEDLVYSNIDNVIALLKKLKDHQKFDELKKETLKQLNESICFFYGGVDYTINVSDWIKNNNEKFGNDYGNASEEGRKAIDDYKEIIKKRNEIINL